MPGEWTLDIEDMSWVENTTAEVDFVVEALDLRGGERVLDLACGFGRHSLELARRGYPVVGVDFTEAYIAHARSVARDERLDNAGFLLADVRDVSFQAEFDVVLNMADGAIGYFDTDEENLKLFDVIRTALQPGGKHVMGICRAPDAGRLFTKGGAMKLSGICLTTENVLALTDFYTMVLGVEAEGDETHMELSTQGTGMALFTVEGMERMAPGSMQGTGSGRVTLAFEVSDVDAEYERLKQLDVEFVMSPTTHPWGARSFWFRDPDGNIVDFFATLR